MVRRSTTENLEVYESRLGTNNKKTCVIINVDIRNKVNNHVTSRVFFFNQWRNPGHREKKMRILCSSSLSPTI